MQQVQNIMITATLFLLLSFHSKAQIEIPVLLNGQNPQVVLHEKFMSRISGFRIFQFRVRQDGSVDSIKIISRVMARDEEEFKRRIDYIDSVGISQFKFRPLKQNTWVQCKVYSTWFVNRTGNKWEMKEKTINYYFDLFNYGYDDLIKNEIDTYFRDEETGKELEYIIRNDWVIFAPTHLIGTT